MRITVMIKIMMRITITIAITIQLVVIITNVRDGADSVAWHPCASAALAGALRAMQSPFRAAPPGTLDRFGPEIGHRRASFFLRGTASAQLRPRRRPEKSAGARPNLPV